MFRLRHKRQRHRSDASTQSVRRPRSRRLTIEAMESRLLLTGNQTSGGDLDYSIWNLDSIQNNYAIISQGDSLPAASSSTSSAAGPAGTQIDVSWVVVPGMSLSANDAQALSYRHYREAQHQGLINFQQASTLYQQWQAGFSTDLGSATVPVYAIGVRNQIAAPVVASEFYSFSSSGVTGSDSTVYLAPPLSISPGWSSPSPSLDLTTSQYVHTAGDSSLTVLNDDVRSSGDFDRDGMVTAQDYRVWRDTVGSSDMLAYSNWKGNFGRSYVLDSITNTAFGDDLAVVQDGMLEVKLLTWNDTTAAIKTSTWNGSLTAVFDAMPESQVAAFVNATTPILNLYPDESSVDVSPLTGEAIADQRLVVINRSVTFATANDANIATSGSVLIFGAGGSANQLVLSPAPVGIDTPVTPSHQSEADDDLAEAIDQLLAEDAIIVVQSGATDSGGVAGATPADVLTENGVALTGTSSNGESAAGEIVPEATVDQLAEGGMISVEKIVGAVTGGSTGIAPDETQIASGGKSTEVVGELSRVAVMELIEGEAEPAAPHAAADHVSLLAANGATNAQPSDSASGERQSVVAQVARAIAEQAGTAASMFAPVNPAYLATIANAAGQAFVAIVGAELNGSLGDAALENGPTTDAARSEAFSQWDDESGESQAATESESSRWLEAAPILMALACERALAAKKKRLQRDPIRQPIKAKSWPSAVC